MKWNELVREGKTLLATDSATNWALGDLALLVEPSGAVGRTTGGNARLEKWAHEIGWERSFLTLLQLRHVANAWPIDKRVTGVSYSVHVALTPLPDRFDAIHPKMKVAEARELIGRAPARGSYGVRPDRIIKSLRDPLVLAKVLEDGEVRAAIHAALADAPQRLAKPWFTRWSLARSEVPA